MQLNTTDELLQAIITSKNEDIIFDLKVSHTTTKNTTKTIVLSNNDVLDKYTEEKTEFKAMTLDRVLMCTCLKFEGDPYVHTGIESLSIKNDVIDFSNAKIEVTEVCRVDEHLQTIDILIEIETYFNEIKSTIFEMIQNDYNKNKHLISF